MKRQLLDRNRTAFAFAWLALPLVAAAQQHAAVTMDSNARKAAEVEEAVIAGGGPNDLVEVRWLKITGTNEQIGRTLAEMARERFGVKSLPAEDALIARTQRQYMQAIYPAMYERMRGVADAYGAKLDDDRFDFSSVGYLLGPPGCSVVFYPASYTADGKCRFSRNYDFGTGSLFGTPPTPEQPGATSRPFLLELHPTDGGYASLAIVSYDLLCGVLDGMNAEGLTVAALADSELLRTGTMEPSQTSQVGFNEISILRYLLDTCANVEEAKAALLAAKQYYNYLPCHYLVADKSGKSFVWEWSAARNKEYVIDGGGKPQITTNFMLHSHPDPSAYPKEEHPQGSFNRYTKLLGQISERGGNCDAAFMKSANASVACCVPTQPGRAAHRTLWHALYCPEDLSVEVDFYLRDEPPADGDSEPTIVRSDYVKVVLEE